MSYKIETLSRREYDTLAWLADRGYDAGILDAAGIENETDETVTLGELPEPTAWLVRDAIEADPDAFLTCNGSETLAAKLYTFINSVV